MPCDVNFTCSDIDDAKSTLTDMQQRVTRVISICDTLLLDLHELLSDSGLLEQLREANSALRTYGEECESETDDLRAELSSLTGNDY
jgi:hypothetical protein